MDHGLPISYMVLEPHTEVFSSDEVSIGHVTHVLADDHEDVFDGVVIAHAGVRRRHVFADADDIAQIFERGVVLKLDAAACEQLPEPTANPTQVTEDPGDRLPGKLRRAWDRISGNY